MLQDVLTNYLKEQCSNGQLQAFIKERFPTTGILVDDDEFGRLFRENVADCRVQLRMTRSEVMAFAYNFPKGQDANGAKPNVPRLMSKPSVDAKTCADVERVEGGQKENEIDNTGVS
jgi:hypothetical protein